MRPAFSLPPREGDAVLVCREQLVYYSTAGFSAGAKGLIPLSLGALDYVWLGGLYDARPAHGVLQVVERRGVRPVAGAVPLVVVDVLQLALLRHVTCGRQNGPL